jgi:competence protein ComEA
MSAGAWPKWLLLGLLATLTTGTALIAVVRSTAPPPAIEVTLPEASPTDGVIKVYVSGAVAHPGIYQLQPGDRYADALAAAGGPTVDADTLAVNMARRARDEDHIHVPRAGEAVTSADGSAVVVLDLNTATLQQLDQLPGIGPVRAQKIVESRAKDGPFTQTDDLVRRKIIPQSSLDQIRELIQVRQ